MKRTGPGERLMVYLEETDHQGKMPLYVEIVERASKAGLAGATVVKGRAGFGASSQVHSPHILSLSDDVPVIVTIIDTTERIEDFLHSLEDLALGGLVVRQPVEIITYAN